MCRRLWHFDIDIDNVINILILLVRGPAVSKVTLEPLQRDGACDSRDTTLWLGIISTVKGANFRQDKIRGLVKSIS